MSSKDNNPHLSKPALATRVDDLRAALQQIPVNLLAEHTGAGYQAIGQGRGEFRLSLFDSPVVITYPELVGYGAKEEELPLPSQAVLIYYFYTSDGSILTGKWVSFADLPDGRIYNPAFQGYSGDEIARRFSLDVDAFQSACERGGGVATVLGDSAYIFHALPRLPLLVNYWCGDEDFPSTCKILFDHSANHYLPTDVCAILGSMLTRKIIKNAT